MGKNLLRTGPLRIISKKSSDLKNLNTRDKIHYFESISVLLKVTHVLQIIFEWEFQEWGNFPDFDERRHLEFSCRISSSFSYCTKMALKPTGDASQIISVCNLMSKWFKMAFADNCSFKSSKAFC